MVYGDSTPFTPCSNTTLTANVLEVQQVTIPTQITVSALGAIGNHPVSGLKGILMLYSDSGGSPALLETYTNEAGIGAGDNRVSVLAGATLPAGTYWIGGEYAAGASICVDTSGNNTLAYVQSAYPAMPSPFGTANVMAGPNFNYYVVGYE